MEEERSVCVSLMEKMETTLVQVHSPHDVIFTPSLQARHLAVVFGGSQCQCPVSGGHGARSHWFECGATPGRVAAPLSQSLKPEPNAH